MDWHALACIMKTLLKQLDIQDWFFYINFDKHFTNTEISKSLHSLWTPVEAKCPLNFCISDVTQLLGSAFQIVLLFCYHGSYNILRWQTTFLPQDRHPHPTPSKDNGNYFPENWATTTNTDERACHEQLVSTAEAGWELLPSSRWTVTHFCCQTLWPRVCLFLYMVNFNLREKNTTGESRILSMGGDPH